MLRKYEMITKLNTKITTETKKKLKKIINKNTLRQVTQYTRL